MDSKLWFGEINGELGEINLRFGEIKEKMAKSLLELAKLTPIHHPNTSLIEKERGTK